MHDTVIEVTRRIAARSRNSRGAYLERLSRAASQTPRRAKLRWATSRMVMPRAASTIPFDRSRIKPSSEPWTRKKGMSRGRRLMN